MKVVPERLRRRAALHLHLVNPENQTTPVSSHRHLHLSDQVTTGRQDSRRWRSTLFQVGIKSVAKDSSQLIKIKLHCPPLQLKNIVCSIFKVKTTPDPPGKRPGSGTSVLQRWTVEEDVGSSGLSVCLPESDLNCLLGCPGG